jgi:hypothetical protein
VAAAVRDYEERCDVSEAMIHAPAPHQPPMSILKRALYAGMSQPDFGAMIERTFKGTAGRGKSKGQERSVSLQFPEWCRITITRELNGKERSFVGPKVYWLEAYAKWADTNVPNEMWANRPVGQLEKCAEAGALRRAFPEEIGNSLTAEEMEGQQTLEGAASAPGKPKPESVTPPSAERERKPVPPPVSNHSERIHLLHFEGEARLRWTSGFHQSKWLVYQCRLS